MSGVEILATEEVVCAWAEWNWLGFLGGVFISILIFLLVGSCIAVSTENAEAGWTCFIAGSIIGGLILGASMGANLGEPIEYETRYKVTISDEVSMNEFLERYEIIDHEGKIYTVREVKE